jgi:branched-chain amino acid transport system substrate-binding protein
MCRAARLLILAVVALGCSRGEPIRVGMVSGLTGRHSDLGISSRNGATLAVSEINEAGGIGRRRLELVVRDDGQDPEQARRAVTELVNAGVVAMIGHATSSMAAATISIVDRARVLMISPTVSSPDFSKRDDWLIRLMVANDVSARRLAQAAVERAHVRRAAVIQDTSNGSYSRTYAAGFRQELEARGGAVVDFTFASGGGASFAALAEDCLRSGADGVMVIANAFDTAAIFQQLRKRSATVKLLGSDWGFTQEILAQGGEAADGAFFPQAVNMMDSSPRFRRFLDAYDARFHRPADFAAVVSYEAVQLLAAGLRRDASRGGIRRAVLDLGTVQGLQGPLRVDRFGDVERRVYLFTVDHGRMVPLE